MKQKLFFVILAFLVAITAQANGTEINGIYYLLDNSTETASVTYTGNLYVDGSNSYNPSSTAYKGSITIPNSVTYDGTTYSVTSIGIGAFYNCTGLMLVEIPNSVTSIGNIAFYLCTGLMNIIIPNSVTKIGKNAFKYCSSITSITIPSSVNIIEEGTFYECTRLTSIEIPNSVTSIGNYAFKGCSNLTSITIPNSVTSIKEEAFYGCSRLKSIEIPNSVSSIGSRAFEGCSSLKNIEIPNSVTSIGIQAFYGCTSLTSIEIPPSITSIKDYMFSQCSGLASIEIPNSVTTIGKSVFHSCSSLTNITIPSSVSSIGSHAFYGCTNLTSITIPSSVISIEEATFYECTCLTSIEIPNSVTSIGHNAFRGCIGLKSIEIPNSVKVIGNTAFCNCTNLEYINARRSDPKAYNCSNSAFYSVPYSTCTLYVPSGSEEAYASTAPWSNFVNIVDDIDNSSDDAVVLTADGEDVWTDGVLRFSVSSEENGEAVVSGVKNKDNLGAVTIPEKVKIADKAYSVTSIGGSAFSRCTGLTSIEIPNSVTSIDDYAFANCSGLTSITIPESVTSIGIGAFYDCSGLTSITIPNSVTSIGIGAFSGCSGLTSIEVEAGNTQYDSREACNAIIETESNTLIAGCMNTIIPNSVTSIGGYAFSGCTGLTSINIPNSVTSIGDYAFASCIGLTNVTIPESVTSIGNQVFEGCSGLTSITIPESVTSIGIGAFYDCSGLTSITIPESVTSIGNYAFAGCSGLTSIEIPNSVTSIGDYAFDGCTGLTSINIPNSVTSIGDYAFTHCTNLKNIIVNSSDPGTYHCSTTAFNDYSATLYVPSGSKEAYKAIEPWSNFANIEEEPIQVGGLRYTIQGDAATCVGIGSVEGRTPVLNIPERITYDGKEYSVTAVECGGGYGSIIVLPKTLKRIGHLSAQRKTIICLSPTPPEIESISVNVNNCVLYVPDEYLEAHRTGWVVDGKLFGYRGFDVESYPNLLEFYIRPMSHLLNYVYDDETMTATVSGFRLEYPTTVISEALGCTSSRMSSTYSERIWAEHNDINLDWVVPATITKFQYLKAGSQTRVKTGETYAVKRVEKLLGARSVTLSEGIEEVGPYAFRLTTWPLVSDAEGNAQYYNDPLESVSLPSTLKLLDWYAFCGCTSLKHVEMKEGLDSIGRGVFTYCLSLEDCHLPASLRAMGYGHGNLYSLQAFSTAQGSENIVAKDGVLFSDGGKTLLQYPAGKPDTTYEVPEGTVKLSEWSFEAVQALESLVLPTSVEEIGSYIFANTHSLKHIYCKSQTPPALTGSWWLKAIGRPDDAALSAYNIYKEVTVHVPLGCKEVYVNAPAWRDFNIVEDINTGIEPLTLTPSETGQTYYNLKGQRITNPQRGQLVIVRYADGTSRKVVMECY